MAETLTLGRLTFMSDYFKETGKQVAFADDEYRALLDAAARGLQRARLVAALRETRNELWIHASAASAAGTIMDREASWKALEQADALLREIDAPQGGE
jgi:hypothetical protein